MEAEKRPSFGVSSMEVPVTLKRGIQGGEERRIPGRRGVHIFTHRMALFVGKSNVPSYGWTVILTNPLSMDTEVIATCSQ